MNNHKQTPGVVIPTFKEAETIGPLIRELLKAVPQVKIVVVDDSPDIATVAAIQGLNLPSVSTIHRTEKGGRGSAVLEGIKLLLAAGCNTIAEMDADLSHPPSQLPALLDEASAQNLDLLIASRYIRGSRIANWPLSRHIFSALANRLARATLRIPVADYTNGYRVYSRGAAELIVNTCGKLGKGFIALSEILVNLYYRGFRIGETPTVFTNRIRGESALTLSEVCGALVGLYKIARLMRELRRQSNVRLEARNRG